MQRDANSTGKGHGWDRPLTLLGGIRQTLVPLAPSWFLVLEIEAVVFHIVWFVMEHDAIVLTRFGAAVDFRMGL